jgi:hypothetical protein
MANPTSNFGWQMPTPTDLVTDLPADFEVFGQAVDSSMADLLGGTSGQILAKNSNTNMDFVWITNDVGDITEVAAGTGISGGGTSGAVTITNSMATEITAKGDLIVGTGNATFDNLPAGTNGYTLVADSSTATGLAWAAAASGNFTLVSRTSFSNVASQAFDSVFTSTYNSYQIMIEDIYATTSTDDLHLQFRYAGPTTQTAAYYYQGEIISGAPGAATVIYVNNGSEIVLNQSIGVAANGTPTRIDVFNVSGVSAKPAFQWQGWNMNNTIYAHGGGGIDTGRVYTGFLLKSSSTNITGTVAIYGRN